MLLLLLLFAGVVGISGGSKERERKSLCVREREKVPACPTSTCAQLKMSSTWIYKLKSSTGFCAFYQHFYVCRLQRSWQTRCHSLCQALISPPFPATQLLHLFDPFFFANCKLSNFPKDFSLLFRFNV